MVIRPGRVTTAIKLLYITIGIAVVRSLMELPERIAETNLGYSIFILLKGLLHYVILLSIGKVVKWLSI